MLIFGSDQQPTAGKFTTLTSSGSKRALKHYSGLCAGSGPGACSGPSALDARQRDMN